MRLWTFSRRTGRLLLAALLLAAALLTLPLGFTRAKYRRSVQAGTITVQLVGKTADSAAGLLTAPAENAAPDQEAAAGLSVPEAEAGFTAGSSAGEAAAPDAGAAAPQDAA